MMSGRSCKCVCLQLETIRFVAASTRQQFFIWLACDVAITSTHTHTWIYTFVWPCIHWVSLNLKWTAASYLSLSSISSWQLFAIDAATAAGLLMLHLHCRQVICSDRLTLWIGSETICKCLLCDFLFLALCAHTHLPHVNEGVYNLMATDE